MMLIQLSLIIIYVCVLLIKTCNESSRMCALYGMGDTANGEYAPRLAIKSTMMFAS